MLKWIKRLLILTVLVGLLWILRAYALRALGEFLVMQEEPRKAQAIVVLSGESPARALGGYDLYQQGFSSTILLTRSARLLAEDLLERRGIPFPSGTEMDRQALIKLGVPEERVVLLEPQARSTMDEAALVKEYFRGRSVQCILLVTSRYHSRRAKLAFEHAFHGTVDVVSVPTPYDEYEPGLWWHKRENVKQLVIEYQKLFYYWAVLTWDFLGELRTFPQKLKEGKAI